MADKQIKDFTAQSPVEYTNKYVTQDASNNTKYTQHSVLLGGWHGGANRWSDNAYYDGAWKYRTTGYAASMYNNSGTLEFYSNTGSAGAAISWNSANILAKKITSNDTTDSSSTSTGSGVFSGGVGIAKNLYVGSNVTIRGANATLLIKPTSGSFSTVEYYDSLGFLRHATRIRTDTGNVQHSIYDGTGTLIEHTYNISLTTGITSWVNTTDSSSSVTGSTIFAGGVGIAKKLYVGTDSHTVGILYGDNVTDSTSSTTGGCIFSGGVGIAKKLYVGTDSHTAGVLYGDSVTDSSSTSTGGAIFAGGVGIAKKLYVGGIGNFTDATDSTSATTGGCIFSGGVGIAKNIYSTGTGITLDNSTNPSLTIKTLDASTGLTVYQGTSGIVWRSGKHSTGNSYVIQRYIAGILQDTPLTISNSTGAWTVPSVINNTNTTDSTSSTTGSMIISGGVGIAKNIYSTGTGITLDNAVTPSITIKTLDASTGLTVYQGTSGIVWRVGKINTSNNFVIQRYIAGVLQDTPFIIGNSTGALGISGTISHTNTTDSSSTITGACIFAGGVGIAKKLYVGTDTHVGGVLYGESTTDSTSSTTGGCIFSGGVGIAKKLYVGTDFHAAGKIYGDDTTESTSTSTGSVIIAGGVGIAKRLRVGIGIIVDTSLSNDAISGTTSNAGAGIYGNNTNSTSGTQNPGVLGESTSGHGVYGLIAHSGTYAGVYGLSTSSTGTPMGVYGQCIAGSAVKGYATGTGAIGVEGTGPGGGYDFYASGAGTDYGTSSSIRWKDKVENIENPLELIEKIRGVRYKDNRYNMIDKIGYIAEEIRDVLPEIVVEEDPDIKENWYKEDGKKKLYCSGLDYSKLGPLHTEAIKELYKIVKSLETLIKEKK